jgi:hypothetical protein
MTFPDISVCTAGPALGHDCFLDSTTLRQVCELGNAEAPLKVFPDHNETVTDLIGAMRNFRIEGDQVKADLELISENPLSNYYAKILDLFPDSIGFSIAWAGSLEPIEGKNFARLDTLTSCDLVSQPAANPSGVYAAKIQTRRLRSRESKGAAKGMTPEEVADQSLPQPVEDLPADVAETLPDSVEIPGVGVDSNPLDTMSKPDSNPTPVTANEALSAALAPIHQALGAIHERLSSIEQRANPAQYEGEGSDEGMGVPGRPGNPEKSKPVFEALSEIRAELSAIKEAATGSSPVASAAFAKEPTDLVAAYEAITDSRERVTFARKHYAALKAVLPKTLNK